MVSEQFREHQWNFESVDCNPNSNATIISDIRNLELQNLSSMPDFIWASFPCVTFSKLNGKKDREAGNWAKTPRAREHDDYILKAFAIMKEVRKHHEHLIVAIENPVGKLRTTPRKCNSVIVHTALFTILELLTIHFLPPLSILNSNGK